MLEISCCSKLDFLRGIVRPQPIYLVGAQKIYDQANSREHAVARGKHSLNLAALVTSNDRRLSSI